MRNARFTAKIAFDGASKAFKGYALANNRNISVSANSFRDCQEQLIITLNAMSAWGILTINDAIKVRVGYGAL